MKEERPGNEHEWLHRFVGEWTWEGEGTMEPGKPPERCQGTESVRALGGFWVVGEGRAQGPDGGPATSIITLGYDPARQRFVGTFIASMMSHLWVYEGALDAGGAVLTLETEGPNMAIPGETAKYRDVVELRSDDHRVMTSHVLGDDGNWRVFMVAHYHRRVV